MHRGSQWSTRLHPTQNDGRAAAVGREAKSAAAGRDPSAGRQVVSRHRSAAAAAACRPRRQAAHPSHDAPADHPLPPNPNQPARNVYGRRTSRAPATTVRHAPPWPPSVGARAPPPCNDPPAPRPRATNTPASGVGHGSVHTRRPLPASRATPPPPPPPRVSTCSSPRFVWRRRLRASDGRRQWCCVAVAAGGRRPRRLGSRRPTADAPALVAALWLEGGGGRRG